MSDETTILYRPVGEKELALIAESGYRAFPPRLFWQPIFYPVLNEEYARDIAREYWIPLCRFSRVRNRRSLPILSGICV